VAPRLERIAQREAVGHQLRGLEARLAEKLREPVGVVTAEVADPPIGRPKALLVCGHAQEEPTTRAEAVSPHPQLGSVILDMLEHLEGANEVEAVVGYHVEHGPHALPGPRSRDRVRLDADVLVAAGQPRPDGPLSGTDLEYALDVVEAVEQPFDHVPAQPGVRGQRRFTHGGVRARV
jgi:hypothetical protein